MREQERRSHSSNDAGCYAHKICRLVIREYLDAAIDADGDKANKRDERIDLVPVEGDDAETDSQAKKQS